MTEPTPKSLFPHKDSLEDVETYLKAQLPISTPNELTAALALYHNTLLFVLSKEYSYATNRIRKG